MHVNKIKWQRDGDSQTKVPFLYEEVNGIPMWRRYNASNMAQKMDEGKNFSKGYLTFLAALKAGYVMEA